MDKPLKSNRYPEHFADYITQKKQLVAQRRPPMPEHLEQTILEANVPFEHLPKDKSRTKGVLLVHGLLDSAHALADLSDYFVSRGFWVRSLLLTGHGTQPQDLLNTTHKDWLQDVSYGISNFQQQVDKLYIVGLSMGATLALNLCSQQYQVAGLMLFAPALAPKNPWGKWAHIPQRIAYVFPKFQWYLKLAELDYAKYCSVPFAATSQACQLMQKTRQLIQTQPLKTPLLAFLSADDETIQSPLFIDYFLQQKLPQNRLILYQKNPTTAEDPRIILRNSIFPKLNVVDFSHTCLQNKIDNPHYGINGDYVNYNHYRKFHQNLGKPNYYGAINVKNLAKYTKLARLTFNPDFDYMLQACDAFIDQT